MWLYVQMSILDLLNGLILIFTNWIVLTHWGRVTHTCVGKLTTIDSDNGLSPGRRQAFIWTDAGILSIRPLGTNVSEILIGIQTFSCKKCTWICRLREYMCSRDQWAAHTQFKPAPKYQRFKVDILLRGSQILHWWWYECTQNGLVCTDMILMLTFSCELWLLSTGYWRPRRGLLANRGINPGGITWPWTTGTLPVFQHSETNIVIKNVVFKYVP